MVLTLNRGISNTFLLLSCFHSRLSFDAFSSVLSSGPSLPGKGGQQPYIIQPTSHLLNTNLLLSVITLTTSFNMAAHSLQNTHTSLLVLKSTPGVERTGFIHSLIWWKKKLRCPGVMCLTLKTDVVLRSGYPTYMISTYNSITSFCVLSIGLGHKEIQIHKNACALL